MSTVSEHHLARKWKNSFQLFFKPLLLVLILVGGILIYHFIPLKNFLNSDRIMSFIQVIRQTWWAPFALIFVAGFGGLLALPATPFSLIIGATYPFALALLYNMIALNLGSSLDFLLARYLGRDFVTRFFKGKLEKFDAHSEKHGFRLMLYLRLVPVFPFISINFGAGLSKIKFWDYFWGTFFGIIPSVSIVTYFASSLMNGTVARKQVFWNVALSSLFLLGLSLVPVFLKKRKALQIKKELEKD